MVIKHKYNHWIDFKQLLNQYIVYMYAKIETERLILIRKNQTKLRAEITYTVLLTAY